MVCRLAALVLFAVAAQSPYPSAAQDSLATGAAWDGFATHARVLEDPDQGIRWPNAITAIGIMGGSRSYSVLHDFIWGRFKGEIDPGTFGAMMVAVEALGWDRAGPSEQAVHELVLGTDPTYWESLPWAHTIAGSPSHARVILSQVAINGLSYTGTSAADSTLKALLERPHHKKQIANAREGLVRNERIKKERLRK